MHNDVTSPYYEHIAKHGNIARQVTPCCANSQRFPGLRCPPWAHGDQGRSLPRGRAQSPPAVKIEPGALYSRRAHFAKGHVVTHTTAERVLTNVSHSLATGTR